MKKEKETYEVGAWCKNCGERVFLYVPKGVTVAKFLKKNKGTCTSCGCAGFIRRYSE